MVIWIIGLSASGKSTLANELISKIREIGNKNVVLLDGDIIRQLMGNDVDHSINGRLKNAERISLLSKFLSDQGLIVIAAVLSIFPEWQKWNRENMDDYFQIHLDVSMDKLIERDPRALYASYTEGKIDNVVGLDIPFPDPYMSDLVIDNNDDKPNFSHEVKQIMLMNKIFDA
jgi:adenylylsulfate kinase